MSAKTWFCCSMITALFLSGCRLDLGQYFDPVSEDYFVDYYRVPCESDSDRLCYQMRTADKANFTISKVAFDDFSSYEWGNRYKVQVETERRSDGKRERFSLQKILETIPHADNEFELTLDTRTGILQPSALAGAWRLGQEIELKCSTFCEEIVAAINANESIRLDIKPLGTELEVAAVVCRAAADRLDEVCNTDKEVPWQIAEFMSDCGFAQAQMCNLYRTRTSAAFELVPLKSGIQNLTWSWGQRHSVKVLQSFSAAQLLTGAKVIEADTAPKDYMGDSNPYFMVVRAQELDKASAGVIQLYGGAGSLRCRDYCNRINQAVDLEEYLLLEVVMDASSKELGVRKVGCGEDDLADFRSCVGRNYPEVAWSI